MQGRSTRAACCARLRGVGRVGVLALVATGVSAAPARAHDPVPIKVLDWNVGNQATLDVAFDSNDELVVSFAHAAEGALKIARGSDMVIVRTLYDVGQPGMNSSVAIDTLGFPHIAHFCEGDGPPGLRYTLDGGDIFGVHTVGITPEHVAYAPVFELDSVDRPYVVYVGESPDAPPLLATFDIESGQWQSTWVPGPPLSTALAFTWPSLAIDSQDRVVVTYLTDEPEISIVVATLEPGGWSFRTHAIDANVTSGPALAFDTIDAPHVAVTFDDRIDLFRFGTLTVTTETAVTAANCRIFPHGLAMDFANRVHLAYVKLDDQALFVASREFGWTSRGVELGTVDASCWAAVALDSDGWWAVAYYDATHDQVKAAGLTLITTTPGDLNCDGQVDFFDIDPFVLALTDPAGYAEQYPDCNPVHADCNRDGLIDFFDIDSFVTLIAS